ncbi:MAG TPA: isoamylase early set domain-containing protein [Gemmatimonadales bacterium]|nr:isoamylase early set domain-containing protein [Gemmatimonadales bacterium]
MTTGYHRLVQRLLDGEVSLAELPPELRAEGEEALRLLAALDRTPVALPPSLDARVMETVRRHAASRVRRGWRWLTTARDVELHVRVRPWTLWAGTLAAAAAVAVVVTRLPLSRAPTATPIAGAALRRTTPDSVYVRFVLYAPGAQRVAVAGTFNHWDDGAAPLMPAGATGVWTTTLALPVGQHQYAFVVDGERWVADPAAPAVDDGFGRRNSLVAVTAQGARTL